MRRFCNHPALAENGRRETTTYRIPTGGRKEEEEEADPGLERRSKNRPINRTHAHRRTDPAPALPDGSEGSRSQKWEENSRRHRGKEPG